MPPTVGSRSRRSPPSSIGAVVNRGPNLASCSAAIAAAVIADATARQEREEAARPAQGGSVPRSITTPPEHRAGRPSEGETSPV
jgi:hypothetical protein